MIAGILALVATVGGVSPPIDVDLAKIGHMTEAFPDASVTDWRPLVASLTSEFGADAHVVAAAIVGRADVIVTENVQDFPRTSTLDQHRIDVQRVDEFLVNQWWLSPTLVRGVVIEMAAARKKPTRTPHQILELLAKLAPEFVDQVRTALT